MIIQKNTEIQNLLCEKNMYCYWNKVYNKNIDNFLIYYYISNLLFFKTYNKNIPYIMKKFLILNNILNNDFFSDKQKNIFLNIFSKCQKIYYSFIKLVNNYKLKKKPVVIFTDLCMNLLVPKQKNVFTLLQNNSVYLFSIYDLIKIFNTSLSNSNNFFPKPFIPKNPYNNVEFNNSTIYNIYFFIKFNNFIISPLIQSFINSNLNLQKYILNSEFIIREYSIHNFVFTSPHHLLYDDTITMLNQFTRIEIDDDFPKNELVEIFKPYLHLFYLYNYFIYGTLKKKYSHNKLKMSLLIFEDYNPEFGKKIVNYVNKVETTTFNTDCIDFNKVYYSENSVSDRSS